MSKSMVEKYEQMLEEDPSSTVFVELARAYLDRGDSDRAIATCQQGIGHHPNSVVGRVLWGKALINVGKAAEAMKQFDLATTIDRENPHAYNLIGEALLRKGLYRSALPILRKAAALQPNDGRIAQWLEQTKTALAGGPSPVLYDETSVDTSSLPTPLPAPLAPAIRPVDAAPRSSSPPASTTVEAPPPPPRPSRPAPAADPDVFAAFMQESRVDPQSEPTVMMTVPQSPSVPELTDQTSELPVIVADVLGGPPSADGRQTVEIPALTPSQRELPVVQGRSVSGENPLPSAPDPFATVPARADANDTFRGLTSTFDALAEGASAELPHFAGAAPPPPVLHPVQPGLLDEVVSAQSAVPTIEFQTVGGHGVAAPLPDVPRRPVPVARAAPASHGLLADIPDEEMEAAPAVAPRVEFNTQATEAIAREYERELREKLEATKQKKTFLQRHGLKLIAAAAAIVILGGLGGSFWVTRHRNQGETLDSALAKGLTGITADTKEQYVAGLRALEQALSMDSGNTAALATSAYSHAMLYAEHGRDPKEREAALAAMTPAVRNAMPEYAVVVEFLTADAATATAARQALLDSPLEKSLVQAHAGRVLLADRKFDDALGRLKKATELDPRQTIALVALGEYYLAFEDWESALEMLARAESLSRSHPPRVVGQAWARLELGRELPEALSDLEGLPKNATIPASLAGRYQLMLGRAQSANGKHEAALKTLTDGLAKWGKPMAFDFQMALGAANRAAGRMAAAQKAYEEATKLNPRSEDARVGLGRVLIARGRERELLERLRNEKDARKIALLRGIAWSRLGDSRKAREELSRTQVGGKTPAEAAVYFALADAADDSQKAIEVLELVLPKARQKSTVQVALARVYMQKNQLDKAKALLEEAAKDPLDYEGNALLGQLLVDAGVAPDIVLEPLQRAVERNGSHALSRHLLTRTLLALGRVDQAAKGIDEWLLDNPGLELAWKDAALTWLEAGRLKDAEGALAKLPATSQDPEAWRIRARVLFARGITRGAMDALETANKLNPKDAETFCEIGHAFVRKGNLEIALSAYGAGLRENPAAACAIAGPLHARPTIRGKPSPVSLVSSLITRSNVAWEKAFLQATLSRLHLEERDYRNALAMAEDATSTSPGSPFGWFAMGEVLRRQKDEAKAREAYLKAAELDGSWSSAHLLLADLLAKQGGDARIRALAEYELIPSIDENEVEVNRAKKAATALRKQLSE